MRPAAQPITLLNRPLPHRRSAGFAGEPSSDPWRSRRRGVRLDARRFKGGLRAASHRTRYGAASPTVAWGLPPPCSDQ